MKKLILCSIITLCLTACNAQDETVIQLQDGSKITFNNVTSTKQYTATKDDKDRQLHFLSVSDDLSSTYADTVQNLEKAGYRSVEKAKSDKLIQVYFKKPKAPLVVADLKKVEMRDATTHVVLSWALN